MKTRRILAFVTLAILATGAGVAARSSQAAGEAPDFDVLVKNGTVYDGGPGAPFKADVAVKDGIIVRVGPRLAGRAGRVIDAGGRIVAPGFIDLHTHVDEAMYFPEGRACLNDLIQGVTTVVVGQCGRSAWPIFETAADLAKLWDGEGIGPNAALLVGHGQVRELVMGDENREPTPEELEKMKALVKAAMDQGACGLSTGLIYEPGIFAKTAEIVELAKVIAPYGGIYHSHIRNERDAILDAVKEIIAVAEQAGVRAHISHIKVIRKSNWGLSKDVCALIEEARARGVQLTADQYPYRFSNTEPYSPLIPRSIWRGPDPGRALGRKDLEAVLDYLRDGELIDLYAKATPYHPLSESHRRFLDGLPRKRLVGLTAETVLGPALASGPENVRERALFLDRLSRPESGAEVRKAIRESLATNGPENWIVGICVDKTLEGKSLQEIAARKGLSPEDAAVELELMGAQAVPYIMSDADLETFMKKDYVATGSDGISPFFGIGRPHIRSYGTFLYKIKEYALTKKTISLSRAIRSMTSLPAEIMNWPDRGRISPGCRADLVVLDLDAVRVPASISNPHQYSRGVAYLLVNGKVAVEGGRFNGTLAGRVIKLKTN